MIEEAEVSHAQLSLAEENYEGSRKIAAAASLYNI